MLVPHLRAFYPVTFSLGLMPLRSKGVIDKEWNEFVRRCLCLPPVYLNVFFWLQLIYSVLPISAVQESDPDIHIYTFFYSRYPPSCSITSDQCCTAGSHGLPTPNAQFASTNPNTYFILKTFQPLPDSGFIQNLKSSLNPTFFLLQFASSQRFELGFC